jgi:predicted metal-binding protein
VSQETCRWFGRCRAGCLGASPSARGTQGTSGLPPASSEPTLYICITCRRPGEPDEPRPGELLASATSAAAQGSGVVITPVKCLANCNRGTSAAMRANGSWTYIFGGLDESCAAALITGTRMLADAADGILPWRGRPELLKGRLIARVPPLHFVEPFDPPGPMGQAAQDEDSDLSPPTASVP